MEKQEGFVTTDEPGKTWICTVTLPDGKYRGEYTGYSDVTKKHHISLYNGGNLKLDDLSSVKFDKKR